MSKPDAIVEEMKRLDEARKWKNIRRVHEDSEEIGDLREDGAWNATTWIGDKATVDWIIFMSDHALKLIAKKTEEIERLQRLTRHEECGDPHACCLAFNERRDGESDA